MGKINFARYLALVAIAVAAVGCGDGNPKTFPVTGVVTLDGKAVPGASITFMPDDSNSKPAATNTDAEGKYAMSTFNQGDGVIPGSYKIIVTKYQRGAEESPYGDKPPEPVEQTPEAISEAYGKGYSGPPKGNQAKAPKEWNDVPDKYGDLNKSGLSFIVEPKPNTFDIKLSKK